MANGTEVHLRPVLSIAFIDGSNTGQLYDLMRDATRKSGVECRQFASTEEVVENVPPSQLRQWGLICDVRYRLDALCRASVGKLADDRQDPLHAQFAWCIEITRGNHERSVLIRLSQELLYKIGARRAPAECTAAFVEAAGWQDDVNLGHHTMHR